MSHSTGNLSSNAIDQQYEIEFRSFDEAWYSIHVLLEGEKSDKLRIKYDNFTDEDDDVFLVEDFKSEDELYKFIERFRKVSVQLQDTDCYNIIKGIDVCASISNQEDDCRFFDAVIEDVLHKKHSYKHGQEVCECIFMVHWLYGPEKGNVACKQVADICLIQGSLSQPKLAIAYFEEIVRRKIKKSLCKSVVIAQHKKNNSSSIVKQKQNFSGFLRLGKLAPRSLNEFWPSKATKVDYDRQDIDVGGDKKLYGMLVQNLEKDLSSYMVSELIHKRTFLETEVYIFPSLPDEPYTKGLIMMNCKKDLELLLGFLQNPNQFIVSSKGRPWVATENMSMNDHWTSMLNPQNKLLNRSGNGLHNNLKIVCSGTEEFKKAKEMKDIFLEFHNHQQRLFKRLIMEERSIQQPSLI